MAELSDTEWGHIIDYVQRHHPNLTRHWFSQLEAQGIERGALQIKCANLPQQRYLTEYCTRPFSEAAQAETGRLISVAFQFSRNGDPASSSDSRPLDEGGVMSSRGEQIRLNPEYTFSQYVVGPSNRLAHAAGVAVGDSPGQTYNPLFIYGSVGLGKTHLLQAICFSILDRNPNAKVMYLSCESFINHFIEAVETGGLHQFRYRYRHVDILLIDDIQFLAERERSQEEFFHTFNTLYQDRKQIVLSADSSPREIPSLEDRLVSRFSWGLVTRIDTPCLETRMAIVRKKAKLRSVELPEDVVHYIAARIDTNTRELEGAITTLDAISQQLGKPVDLKTAREALGEIISNQKTVTIPSILEAVSQYYSVKKSEVQGKRRLKSIAHPRQVCMYLARELTTHSLEEIGSFFGGRDHTTVIHAARQINKLAQADSNLLTTLETLKNRIASVAQSES